MRSSFIIQLLVLVFSLGSISCMTQGLHESQQKAALPIREIQRTPVSLVGQGLADAEFDIYRFQGWLAPDKKPRQFDLYLPKNRTQGRAVIREVTSAKTKKSSGRTITASIDMRYTSNMLLTDPVFRKNTNLAIGESLGNEGKCVSVSLREPSGIYHWDAALKLDWVKRDKADIKSNNLLYAVTVPADAVGYAAAAMIKGSD